MDLKQVIRGIGTISVAVSKAIYFYPQGKKVSFYFVADNYARQLMRFMPIYSADEDTFYRIQPNPSTNAIIHPYFYIAMRRLEDFKRIVTQYGVALGVDVADSDLIASTYVDLTNLATALIVPSTWSAEAYKRSGVSVDVHVVPHGLTAEFFRPPRPPVNIQLRRLWELKAQRDLRYVYFHLWHSGYRKGADLVCEAMKRVQNALGNAVLVVKKMEIDDPHMLCLRQLKTFVVEGMLSVDDMVDMYDIMDVALMPSRGGGFELVGLEALARGVPTLVPSEGSWQDYVPPPLKHMLSVAVCRRVRVLPDNSIHVGLGPEVCVDDLAAKTIEALLNLEEWRARLAESREWFKKFTWDAVGTQLYDVVRRYIT